MMKININFPQYQVAIEDNGDRVVKSNDRSFNMVFKRCDGYTAKWGKKPEDNPTHCSWGNEIADIEITTSCSGIRDKEGNRSPCAFCFPKGTNITMADGSLKDISEIEVGDKVLSYHNGQRVENVVKEVYCRDYTGKLLRGFAYYSDSRHRPRCHILPDATPEHPFMVRNGNEYEEVRAADLKYRPEAELLFDDNQDGWPADLEEINYCGKVYNFHCEPDAMYFADGVLVHNCYKANTPKGSYMTFETFKRVFDLMNQPRTMTQIALGVDAECKTNPDVWRIMDYCLENNVVPNVTVADISQETAENIVKRCGACAVSCYERNKDCCYDSIKLLVDEAKKQGQENFKVNMHLLVSKETEHFVMEVLHDRIADKRLSGMGAIVLLSLKQKGRGKAFHKMDYEAYAKAIEFLQDHNIAYGSDSCGANKLMQALKEYHSVDRWAERIKSKLCDDKGKCLVVQLGEKQFLAWSKSNNPTELYAEHYLICNKVVKNAISCTNAMPISDVQVALPFDAKVDGKEFVQMGMQFSDEDRNKLKRCHFKSEIVDSQLVDVKQIEPCIKRAAETESRLRLENALQSIENCESLLYSIYVNVEGIVYPCSFMEGEGEWKEGIDLKDDKYKNFTTQVWNHPKVLAWRQNAVRCIKCNGCNQCPHYEV